MLCILRKKAQSTAEYAILIGLVVAAITAMQIFIKTGLQKQIKLAVDHLNAEGVDTSAPGTDFGITSANTNTNQNINDTEALQVGGGVNRTSTGNVTSQRNETIGW